MSKLTEYSNWEEDVYQIEVTDPLLGGTPDVTVLGNPLSGFLNVAPQQLANRTLYLKSRTDTYDSQISDLTEATESVSTDLYSHIGSRSNSHGTATQTEAGFMSAADKTKLNGITAGAQPFIATNLAQGTRTTTTVPVTSSTGTSATLTVATTTLAGVMSSADKTKLDGVAAGAQVNQNSFSVVAVAGQSNIVADSASDTMTIVAGSGVVITTDASTDTLTIAASSGPTFTLAQIQAIALSL